MSERCIPTALLKKLQAKKLQEGQTTLDSLVKAVRTVKKFTKQGILAAIACFVACDDQVKSSVLQCCNGTEVKVEALAVANKPIFRNCLVTMRPKTRSKELPSTHDVVTYIHNEFGRWM